MHICNCNCCGEKEPKQNKRGRNINRIWADGPDISTSIPSTSTHRLKWDMAGTARAVRAPAQMARPLLKSAISRSAGLQAQGEAQYLGWLAHLIAIHWHHAATLRLMGLSLVSRVNQQGHLTRSLSASIAMARLVRRRTQRAAFSKGGCAAIYRSIDVPYKQLGDDGGRSVAAHM